MDLVSSRSDSLGTSTFKKTKVLNFLESEDQKILIPLKDLLTFDLRFGFLVKNCIYGQLERSGDPKFGPNT